MTIVKNGDTGWPPIILILYKLTLMTNGEPLSGATPTGYYLKRCSTQQ